MPGICGYIEQIKSPNSGNILSNMVGALKVRPTDIIGTHTDQSIHFGCVQLEINAKNKQPALNNDRTIVVVLAGEIFDWNEKKNALRQQGYIIEDDNPAQFIASLYQEEGLNFPHSLNGAFAIALWDNRTQKLILSNDRLGYEPLYYARTPKRILFASGMRSLLSDPELPRKVNFQAIAQFLTYDHVLGNHTFLTDFNLLPPGSILTFSENNINIDNYWKLEFQENSTYRIQEDYQEELIFLLRQAMARQWPQYPATLMLSGGLDSRVLLALLSEKQRSIPLKTFTFGQPNSNDVRYAKELSKKTDIPHDYQSLHPDYLSIYSEMGIKLTDGMENIVHMHTLDNLKTQAAETNIIYKGFLGDALTGYFSFRDLLSFYQDTDLTRIFLERYPIVFNPAIHTQLFTPKLQSQLQDNVIKTMQSELTTPEARNSAANLFFRFDLSQRQRRLTLNGVLLVRSQAIVRTPFYDNDLLDFFLRLPQGYRLDRYLIKQAFIKTYPGLSKIPSTADGYPLMPCLRESIMHLDERVRWRLQSTGFRFFKVPQKQHYASYNEWFRGPMRGWVQSILQSESFRSREYYNQTYVQKLLDEHMNGHKHYQKLGALISVELWNRQFLD